MAGDSDWARTSRPDGTVNTASIVYGAAGPQIDDPAEAYHEASKFYPSFLGRSARGARDLDLHPELGHTLRRATKRSPHRARIELPAPDLPPFPLRDALLARASARVFADASLTLAEVSSLLGAAYGTTDELAEGWPRRTVPSGGALYPLEVYPIVLGCDGLDPGIYHYDPLAHALELLDPGDPAARLADATTYAEIALGCRICLAVTAVFWRTRFKYGLRGYRFALLEAGHLGQNVLLAAAVLGLAAVPLGGVYDARLESLLDADGVDESVVYAFCLGRAP